MITFIQLLKKYIKNLQKKFIRFDGLGDPEAHIAIYQVLQILKQSSNTLLLFSKKFGNSFHIVVQGAHQLYRDQRLQQLNQPLHREVHFQCQQCSYHPQGNTSSKLFDKLQQLLLYSLLQKKNVQKGFASLNSKTPPSIMLNHYQI